MAGNLTNQHMPWLAHYDAGVPEKIAYEKIGLVEYLSRSVQKFPDRMALAYEGFKITYSQLDEMVQRFAASMRAFGIQKGDRVAILLPNVIACVVSYYACLKIGAIAVMNNPVSSDPELEYQLNDSGAKLLVTLDLLVDRAIRLRMKTAIEQIIYTSFKDHLPFGKGIYFSLFAARGLTAKVKYSEDVYAWKDLINDPAPEPLQADLDFEDTAMLQYTGGTTGVSKGVMLSHGNLSCQIQQINAWFPQFAGKKEIILGALPFFHSFGLTCAMNNAIFAGWGNVLVAKASPENLLSAVRKYRPTFLPLVPTMYIGMLSHPDIHKSDLTCIKGCFSGSAPLPVEVIKKFERLTGAAISEGFGLTESSPITHANPFQGKRKVGSVGLPFPDTQCRIVDLNDGETAVAIGETGELVVKGPQVMKGYWNRPKETAEALKAGWLYTGDIAKMDEEGYFYVVDRKKDMIISGGLNVYPREIDEVFYSHPKVLEACSIGIPHPTRGEQVKVFVVLNEDKAATSEELLEYCKSRLAKYKLPTQIEFRKELPKSNVGKVLRKTLKEEEMKKHKK